MTEAVSLQYDRRPSALPYMLRGMLPVARRPDLAPRISAHWHGHRADPDEVAEFSRTTGLRAGGAMLPLLYPQAFGFRLAMAILTHPRFPVPIWGVLQTRNHLVQHRALGLDAPLDFDATVLPGRAVAKGAEFDVRTTVHVAGALAWESVVTFFTRGRFGEPGPDSPLARPPGEIGPPVTEWVMRDAGNRQFGRFTGDYNGIHLWDWYARRFGFRHALYHPSRVLGECLARLHEVAPLGACEEGRWRLDAWLKGPVSHGARVRMHAATGPGVRTFALFTGEERPCVVGRLAALETSS